MFWLLAALALILIAFNFLNFQIARSRTETNHTLSTYRTGEGLPDNMMNNFTITISANGEEILASDLEIALKEALERQSSVSTATVLDDIDQKVDRPILLVNIEPERLWTPVYGQATVTAQIFYAYDGNAPWPLNEPVVFRVSPAVKADGEFIVEDTTWGLLSKPAYSEHLAKALAKSVVSALQDNAFAED
jgi:hypothetical protein